MRYQALAIVLLSARGVYCAGSTAPIYGKTDAVADSAIVGVWRGEGDTTTADSTVIERANPLSSETAKYLLTLYSADGTERDDLYLTRIGGTLFADVYPAKQDSWNSIPIHAIFLGRAERDRLIIHAADGRWLQTYSASHPKEIKTDSVASFILFTDSTVRVRAFLASHKNSGLWATDSLVLVRAPVPGTR